MQEPVPDEIESKAEHGVGPAEGLAEAESSKPDQTEDALWVSWCQGGDRDARLKLILKYLWLAKRIAHSVLATLNSAYAELRDLMQSAAVGLVDAVDRFDPGRRVPFASYAGSRIRGSVLNQLQKHSEYHAQFEFRRDSMRERAADLASASEDDHSSGVFAEMIDLAVGLAVGYMLEGTSLYRSEESHLYEGNHEINAAGETFKSLVGELPDTDRSVLELHYIHGMPFADIAAGLELTRGRVSQIHSRALKLLRERFRERPRLDISF